MTNVLSNVRTEIQVGDYDREPYKTRLLLSSIQRLGRAVVLCIDDDQSLVDDYSPTIGGHLHMTVAFCRAGAAPDSILEIVRQVAEGFIQKGNTVSHARVLTFGLVKWGPNSMLVSGQLFDFYQAVQVRLPEDLRNERPAHIALHKHPRK